MDFKGYNFSPMNAIHSDRVNKLSYWLLKDVDKAIHQFDMIENDDRIAVAISGGKDSLTLLKLLDIRRKHSPQKYSLLAIHILGNALGPKKNIPPSLLAWLNASEIDFLIEPMELPQGETLPMDCHRCTWNRRKTLFKVAHDQKCNKIAMGHHANDLAETTLLNLIFNGRVETMAPISSYFDGIFHLIRPLCYLKQKDIDRFSRLCGFPTQQDYCPQTKDSRRQKVAKLINEVEIWGKDFSVNLLRTGLKSIQDHEDLPND